MNCIQVTATAGWRLAVLAGLILLPFAAPPAARAETGYDAWLRYAPINDRAVPRALQLAAGRRRRAGRFATSSPPPKKNSSAACAACSAARSAPPTNCPAKVRSCSARSTPWAKHCPRSANLPELPPDGYWLKSLTVDGRNHLLIAAPTDRGVLYGAFRLLRMIGLAAPIADLNLRDKPYAPIRILNHWDNLDGTIETRLRRPLDLLGERPRGEGPQPRAGLCPADGLGRHQRLLDQQRQCRRRA